MSLSPVDVHAPTGPSKRSLDELAVFGGAPTFAEPLHVGRPNIGDKDAVLARISDLLDRRWLTNDGPFVQEFEQRIAEHLGVRNVVAMCNGTVALEIAIRALGLSGEVIVPSFTFVATAHALQWQEITPVFCDVDPESHTIDPARVEELITPRTTGILGVHLWGRVCDVAALQEIAQRRGLQLLFDAAHAFGNGMDGTMVGRFGRAEVFSFHATKFLNSFEGGAVATDDDDLAQRMRLMRNFGFEGLDTVTYVGTNGKMTEVAAAMGLTSLESIDHFVAVNRRNHASYRAGLEDIAGLRLLEHTAEPANHQYVVLEVTPAAGGLTRDHLLTVLRAENVLARRYFYPGVHRMEPYRSFFPHAGLLLPRTEELSRTVLTLPTGTAVDAGTVDAICNVIRVAMEHGPEVEGRLGGTAPPDLASALR